MIKDKSGFTFIELLVVITIVAILSAVGMVSYQSTNRGSRDAKRKADLENIRSALEICRIEDGRYPASVDFGGDLDCNGGTVSMQGVPEDPKNAGSYVYSYVLGASPFTTYTLSATLEKDDSVYTLTNP
jgi:general secretion pathway protein G